MHGRCQRHPFERAADTCDRCGFEFCDGCLVYAFGETDPPHCIPCAIVTAGALARR